MKVDLNIFNYANKGVLVSDPDGNILFLNNWLREKFKIRKNEEKINFKKILPERLLFLKDVIKKSYEENKIIFLSYALHSDRMFFKGEGELGRVFFNLYIIPFEEKLFLYFDNITPYISVLKRIKNLNKEITEGLCALKEEKQRYELIAKLTDIFNEEYIFIKEASKKILDLLKEYFLGSSLTFFFYNKVKNTLTMFSNIKVGKKVREEFSQIDIFKGNTFSAKLLKTCKSPAFVNDTQKYYKIAPTFKKLKSKSIIFIPLIDFKGEPIGMIHIGFRKKQKFLREIRDFIRLISKNISIGIAKIMLTDELKEYSYKLKEMVEEKTEELKKMAFLYSALIENQSEIICRLDKEMKILFANNSFLRFFKRNKYEVEGKNFLEFFDKNNKNFLLISLESLNKENIQDELILNLKTPNGIRTVIFSLKLIFKNSEIDGYQIVGRDITRRKRAEELIRRQRELIKKSEKLAMLGRVSASIVHEINTPVTYIRTNSELINQQINNLIARFKENNVKKEEILRELEEIKHNNIDVFKGTDRIINITRGMKAFVKGEVEKNIISLSEIVNEALNLTYPRWHGKINLHKEVSADTKVFCIKGQLEQVIINLLLNAIDAVKKSGRKEIWIRGWDDEFITYIEIEDTGEGIPKENLSRIFNPLFSTKDVNEGTGLGLSVVKDIIESHNGAICVDSELDRGTKFTIKLPSKEGKNGQIKINNC